MNAADDAGSIARTSAPAACRTEASGSAVEQHWSIPQIVAHAFVLVDAPARVRLLSRLLRAVGPLALAVIGGGAFSRFVWQACTVTIDDAVRATPTQIFELASYVQQSNPAVTEQVIALLSQDVYTMSALGASAAAVVISLVTRYAGRPQ